MDAKTSQRKRARAAKRRTQPVQQQAKESGDDGRSAASLSEAARKAWETRRARGWEHPRKVRPLTAKEIADATGVPLRKVQRIMELSAKRVPAGTPVGKGR